MNDERWTLVDRLLGAALEREPHERAAFLHEACGGDEKLRLDVESLITHASSGMNVLSTPAVALAGIQSAETSMMGRHLGPYAIAARLGAGGMGEVYRARDTKLGRDVAIKILPRIFATAPDRRARLDREARLLAALNHPHIGAIYGLEELDGTPALILELVEGETLGERIAKGPIPLTETLRIARQITDALDAAHEKGIVHRDLKPANIKITQDGIVKVLDFGLAKAAGGDGSGPDLTQSPTVAIGGTHDGVILGTAPYMSPEQARGKPVDKRTDVWAFGCVLYEMLTGRVAFAGDTVSDTIVTILEREPEWSALPAATPAPIRRLLLRCVEKDAKRRLRDIGDARTEIDDVLRDGAVAAPPAATAGPTAPSGAQVAAAPAWGRRVALVLALLGLCLAGAVGVYLATRGGSPSSAAATFSLQDAEIVSLTTTGNATLPSLSFDGQWVTYVQQDDDGESLWIRRTTTTNPPVRLVESRPGIHIWGATITPDASWVDFLQQEGKERFPKGVVQLMRVSSTGGTTPKKLIDNVHTPVAYSPDGRMMVFERDPKPRGTGPGMGGGSQLVLADVQGQNERVLAEVPPAKSFGGPWFFPVRHPGSEHVRPAWSPDGQVIAIPGFTFNGGPAPYAMFVTVPDGKIEAVAQATMGTGAWIDPSSLVWSQEEGTGAPFQLWRLTYPAAERSRLTNDFSSYIGVSLSADRDSLVTAKTDNRAGISILDNTATSGRDVVTDAAISPVVEGSSVAWAPGRLLYSARTGDHFELRAFYPKRNHTESIVTDAYSPAATSDGTIVYVSTSAGERFSLWRADADGTHRTKLANHALWPVTTHDDQHVIFVSAIPGLAMSPYSVPIKEGKPVQIINRRAYSLDVSSDDQLAFTSESRDDRDRRGVVLVVCALNACESTQKETPLVNSEERLRIRWARGRGTSGVAYVRVDDGQQNIWVQPLDDSPAKRLTTFMDGRKIIDFAWSRDGKQLAIARPTGHSDIVLFKNLWRRP